MTGRVCMWRGMVCMCMREKGVLCTTESFLLRTCGLISHDRKKFLSLRVEFPWKYTHKNCPSVRTTKDMQETGALQYYIYRLIEVSKIGTHSNFKTAQCLYFIIWLFCLTNLSFVYFMPFSNSTQMCRFL